MPPGRGWILTWNTWGTQPNATAYWQGDSPSAPTGAAGNSIEMSTHITVGRICDSAPVHTHGRGYICSIHLYYSIRLVLQAKQTMNVSHWNVITVETRKLTRDDFEPRTIHPRCESILEADLEQLETLLLLWYWCWWGRQGKCQVRVAGNNVPDKPA